LRSGSNGQDQRGEDSNSNFVLASFVAPMLDGFREMHVEFLI
jgi:hypothetical protein